MSEQDARNDQSAGHIIERTDGALPQFYSATVGRNFGAPYNGWISERDQATVLSVEEAERLLAGGLVHQAPFCKVVPK